MKPNHNLYETNLIFENDTEQLFRDENVEEEIEEGAHMTLSHSQTVYPINWILNPIKYFFFKSVIEYVHNIFFSIDIYIFKTCSVGAYGFQTFFLETDEKIFFFYL